MAKAILRHESKEAVVIPIILTHCDWTDTPFSKIQALPKDAIPIMDRRWDTEDQAMQNVALGLRAIVTRRLKERENSLSNYFQEIAALKEEKEKLATELKFSRMNLEELEKKIKANSESQLFEKN